jgi:hypothetical protein
MTKYAEKGAFEIGLLDRLIENILLPISTTTVWTTHLPSSPSQSMAFRASTDSHQPDKKFFTT